MISVNLEDEVGSEVTDPQGQHQGTDSPGAAALRIWEKPMDLTAHHPLRQILRCGGVYHFGDAGGRIFCLSGFERQVMEVANAPGEKIYPGELAKALKILADGRCGYVGGSAVELIGPGESAGNYRQIEISGGKIATVRYR